MEPNIDEKKVVKENIEELLNRAKNAQIYLKSKNAKKIDKIDGYDIKQRISEKAFLEMLLEIMRELDSEQQNKNGAQTTQKTKDIIRKMYQSVKNKESVTLEEMTEQLDKVRALTPSAKKYFRFEDKYAILDFVQKRFKSFHDIPGTTSDEKLDWMVEYDRFWPNESQKVFENLNTRDNIYKMFNGSEYVDCNLVQSCANNTEREAKSKMDILKENIDLPGKSAPQGCLTLKDEMEALNKGLNKEFNKQKYPNINDVDMVNSQQLVGNHVQLRERMIKFQRLIDMVQDINSPLDFEKRNKILQSAEKDMQKLMEEMQKSQGDIDSLKEKITHRVSDNERAEQAVQKEQSRRVIDDSEMKNLAENRTLEGINGASNKVRGFFKKLIKGKEKNFSEEMDNSDI